jgi:hypothetical protein
MTVLEDPTKHSLNYGHHYQWTTDILVCLHVLCIWSRNYRLYYRHSCEAKHSIHLNVKLVRERFTWRNVHILVCSRYLCASRFSIPLSKPIYNSKNETRHVRISLIYLVKRTIWSLACVTRIFESIWALIWTATAAPHGLMLVQNVYECHGLWGSSVFKEQNSRKFKCSHKGSIPHLCNDISCGKLQARSFIICRFHLIKSEWKYD